MATCNEAVPNVLFMRMNAATIFLNTAKYHSCLHCAHPNLHSQSLCLSLRSGQAFFLGLPIFKAF